MGRDFGSELDHLKAEVDSLRERVEALANPPAATVPEVGATPVKREGQADPVSHRVAELRDRHPTALGRVSYYGFFETSHGGSTQAYSWDMAQSADDLLAMDDERVASVLAALGSKQRLAILKSILKAPASAAQLVERLSLGTTGQVYHHLKALQAADLITQEGRGLFVFKGHRVQSLLMLLVGVADALDGRYSSGTWQDQSQP